MATEISSRMLGDGFENGGWRAEGGVAVDATMTGGGDGQAALSTPRSAAGTRGSVHAAGGAGMTVPGSVRKGALLLGITSLVASVTWNLGTRAAAGAAIAASLVGLVVALLTVASPERARGTAVPYAVLEGVAMGGYAAWADSIVPGVARMAALATLVALGGMLAAYRAGLLRPTALFVRIVVTATGSVAALYVVTFALGLVGVDVPFVHHGGPVGIGVTLVVIGVAALNLILDFAVIEEGARQAAPVELEWYAAFSLLVTLVWIYVEIARLLVYVLSSGEGDD